MSDLDQSTRAHRTADAAHSATGCATSRTGLPPGLPPGAEVPPVMPDDDLDGDSAPRRGAPAPLRLAAAVTAVAVLGALVIGVSGRSAIGETPPQRPGVGGQVAAAERAQAQVPAAGQGREGDPDSFTSLVVDLEGSGDVELVVGSALGVERRQVSLPYRGSVPAFGDPAVATTTVRVTATAGASGSLLRCRLLNGNRLLKTDSARGRVDCSVRAS